MVAGVIYDPLRDEMFSAARGKGASSTASPSTSPAFARSTSRSSRPAFPATSATTAPTSTSTRSSRCAPTAFAAPARPPSTSPTSPAAVSTATGSSNSIPGTPRPDICWSRKLAAASPTSTAASSPSTAARSSPPTASSTRDGAALCRHVRRPQSRAHPHACRVCCPPCRRRPLAQIANSGAVQALGRLPQICGRSSDLFGFIAKMSTLLVKFRVQAVSRRN